MATRTPTPPPPGAEVTNVDAPDATPSEKPAAKKAAAKEKEAVKVLHYRSKTYPIHHPYQNLKIPISGSVRLVPDSWVEVQVAAGLIFVVEA